MYYTAIYNGFVEINGKKRMLFLDVRYGNNIFRNHLCVHNKKNKLSHNKLKKLDFILFTGDEIEYTNKKGQTKKGFSKIRNIMKIDKTYFEKLRIKNEIR